jgi:hypothetical protein
MAIADCGYTAILARGAIVDHGLKEQGQDAEALGNEQQVPDRIEEREGALDLGCGNRLVLDGGELVTQLSHGCSSWSARAVRSVS